jgi:hypothetical protein
MNLNMIPFNLDLLILSADQLKTMKPVKVLDIFLPSSKNFHPEGLFSTEIFGRIGDDRRNYTFSYIDLNTEMIHPLIYEVLDSLKGLYTEIMQSKTYATWNEDIKDFEKSTPTVGETGYSFFMKHVRDIVFQRTGSDRRDFSIRLIEKYKNKFTLSQILVMPAGIRDFEFDESGKPSEDEINSIYRKILSLSNLLYTSRGKNNTKIFDSIRASLQAAIFELYSYIKDLLQGKHKLVLGKWGARRIQNGTRNVISTVNNEATELNSPLTTDFNDTIVGLFQFMKATLPITIHNIKSGFLTQVFLGPNSPAVLVNPKTLKKENVQISSDLFDLWMTAEGIEKLINQFAEDSSRFHPILVGSHYLGLIYQDSSSFMLLQDIADLPERFDKSLVRPINYAEFYYIMVEEISHRVHGFFTRYPVAGYGGIYPSSIYLKTTIPSLVMHELSIDGNPTGRIFYEYPKIGADFLSSMAPSTQHLAKLAADFDGDTCSLNIVLTDEANAEIKKLLKSKKYYIDAAGNINFSAKTDALQYTVASMTA